MVTAHEQLQRLSVLKQQGVLTDAEFERRRTALIDAAVSGNTAAEGGVRPGRNIGQVLLGALGGFWLGFLFIGALLLLVPKDRRADRLFGSWFGMVAGGLVLAVLIAALVVSGADAQSGGSSSQSADASADRVVAVMLRCDIERRERTGEDCTRSPNGATGYLAEALRPKNVRLELTVRTSAATTYTVEVPPDSHVVVGDVWPPD